VTTLTKKKLLDELQDKETRDIFVEEHVTAGIPFQLHALREKLGLSQSELARRAGMAQERISVLEDPNYEFIPKINTLLKLASVFDVPLIVKFGKWSELFQWETNLSPDDLAPATFDEEIEELEKAASNTAEVVWASGSFKVTTLYPDDIILGNVRLFTPHTIPVQFVSSAVASFAQLYSAPVKAEEEAMVEQEPVEFIQPPLVFLDRTNTYPM
jgi:transcriptional regulator with XRE-family HTH domain